MSFIEATQALVRSMVEASERRQRAFLRYQLHDMPAGRAWRAIMRAKGYPRFHVRLVARDRRRRARRD